MVKNTKNKTPKKAMSYLVNLGKGFHEVTSPVKKQIAEKFDVNSRVFDLIKLPKQICKHPIDELEKIDLKKITLIEMKSNSNPKIDRSTLKDFYFGYTVNQRNAAKKLKKKYRIVFVVVPRDGSKKFHVEMSDADLWDKAKNENMTWHISFK